MLIDELLNEDIWIILIKQEGNWKWGTSEMALNFRGWTMMNIMTSISNKTNL